MGEAVKCQQGVEIDGHFLFQARSLNMLERIARKSGNEPTPAWLLAWIETKMFVSERHCFRRCFCYRNSLSNTRDTRSRNSCTGNCLWKAECHVILPPVKHDVGDVWRHNDDAFDGVDRRDVTGSVRHVLERIQLRECATAISTHFWHSWHDVAGSVLDVGCRDADVFWRC